MPWSRPRWAQFNIITIHASDRITKLIIALDGRRTVQHLTLTLCEYITNNNAFGLRFPISLTFSLHVRIALLMVTYYHHPHKPY